MAERKERRVTGPALTIEDLAYPPEYTPAFYEPNSLLRVLAHLAAWTGTVSKLLKCDSQGRLLVAGNPPTGPVEICDGDDVDKQLAVDAEGHAQVDVAAAVPLSPVNVADGSTPAQKLAVDAEGHAQVDVISGGGGELVAIRDGTTPTQTLAVSAAGTVTAKLCDGTTADQKLCIDSGGSAYVAVTGTVGEPTFSLGATTIAALATAIADAVAAKLAFDMSGRVKVETTPAS
jgi:hypothetical protein